MLALPPVILHAGAVVLLPGMFREPWMPVEMLDDVLRVFNHIRSRTRWRRARPRGRRWSS